MRIGFEDEFNTTGEVLATIEARTETHSTPETLASTKLGLERNIDGYEFTVRTGPDVGPVYFYIQDPLSSGRSVYQQELSIQCTSADNGLVYGGTINNLRPGDFYGLKIGDSTELIADPYGHYLTSVHTKEDEELCLSAVIDHEFDWGDSRRPEIAPEERVIYEAHIQSSTMLHPDIPDDLRGTYRGFVHDAHLQHLKDLGVTTIELQPVQQFFTNKWLADKNMRNYWGYGTSGFFAPHAEYATNSTDPQAVVDEFKTMVKRLHEEGFEVILDVVYNHTGENHPIRHLDNQGYYRVDEHGNYIDFTGCGNTIDTSRPAGRQLVLDSLRFWAKEMRVDGFRFDLAPVLARQPDGRVDVHDHPLIDDIMKDNDLNKLLLIAEPWDIHGYPEPRQQFMARGWGEWSGEFRDGVRDFWHTDAQYRRIGSLAGFMYGIDKLPGHAVNFITAHDGFTLSDLVSYNTKHNELNGEQNRDGTDNNRSNNHGYEGTIPHSTQNERLQTILTKRLQTIRNLATTSILSCGTPMILGGDEVLHSKNGNNNTYNQPDLSHINWDATSHSPLIKAHLHFMRELILTKRNSEMRIPQPHEQTLPTQSPIGEEKVHWINAQGENMSVHDWNSSSLFGIYISGHGGKKSILQYVNAGDSEIYVRLPSGLAVAGDYSILVDTSTGTADHENTQKITNGFVIAPNSVVVAERLSSMLPSLSQAAPSESIDINDLSDVVSIDPHQTTAQRVA